MNIILNDGTSAYNVKNSDLAELKNHGLVDDNIKSIKEPDENLKTCAICGKKYAGYGNSTWGYWFINGYSKENDEERGEKFRCCNDCNFKYVVPARIKLASNNQ